MNKRNAAWVEMTRYLLVTATALPEGSNIEDITLDKERGTVRVLLSHHSLPEISEHQEFPQRTIEPTKVYSHFGPVVEDK